MTAEHVCAQQAHTSWWPGEDVKPTCGAAHEHGSSFKRATAEHVCTKKFPSSGIPEYDGELWWQHKPARLLARTEGRAAADAAVLASNALGAATPSGSSGSFPIQSNPHTVYSLG